VAAIINFGKFVAYAIQDCNLKSQGNFVSWDELLNQQLDVLVEQRRRMMFCKIENFSTVSSGKS
jgi:hypothetical protein